MSPLGIGGFAAMRALSTRNDDPQTASRPWDRDRDGFVLGEGAGVRGAGRVLEHAKARGAQASTPNWSGLRHECRCRSHDRAQHGRPPPRHAAMRLRNAGVNADRGGLPQRPRDVDASGRPERKQRHQGRALGDHAHKIVVNSTKSMTGHLLGGAGGIESRCSRCWPLHHQKSPPTTNIFNQDPECDLDYCANTARDMKIDVAVKNNFGFGGTNGTLVFKRV